MLKKLALKQLFIINRNKRVLQYRFCNLYYNLEKTHTIKKNLECNSSITAFFQNFKNKKYSCTIEELNDLFSRRDLYNCQDFEKETNKRESIEILNRFLSFLKQNINVFPLYVLNECIYLLRHLKNVKSFMKPINTTMEFLDLEVEKHILKVFEEINLEDGYSYIKTAKQVQLFYQIDYNITTELLFSKIILNFPIRNVLLLLELKFRFDIEENNLKHVEINNNYYWYFLLKTVSKFKEISKDKSIIKEQKSINYILGIVRDVLMDNIDQFENKFFPEIVLYVKRTMNNQSIMQRILPTFSHILESYENIDLIRIYTAYSDCKEPKSILLKQSLRDIFVQRNINDLFLIQLFWIFDKKEIFLYFHKQLIHLLEKNYSKLKKQEPFSQNFISKMVLICEQYGSFLLQNENATYMKLENKLSLLDFEFRKFGILSSNSLTSKSIEFLIKMMNTDIFKDEQCKNKIKDLINKNFDKEIRRIPLEFYIFLDYIVEAFQLKTMDHFILKKDFHIIKNENNTKIMLNSANYINFISQVQNPIIERKFQDFMLNFLKYIPKKSNLSESKYYFLFSTFANRLEPNKKLETICFNLFFEKNDLNYTEFFNDLIEFLKFLNSNINICWIWKMFLSFSNSINKSSFKNKFLYLESFKKEFESQILRFFVNEYGLEKLFSQEMGHYFLQYLELISDFSILIDNTHEYFINFI